MTNEQPTKRFLAEYYHDGAWWAISVYAYDFADAEIRCKKLSLQLLGEHKLTVPAVGGNRMADALTWLLNRFGRRGDV